MAPPIWRAYGRFTPDARFDVDIGYQWADKVAKTALT